MFGYNNVKIYFQSTPRSLQDVVFGQSGMQGRNFRSRWQMLPDVCGRRQPLQIRHASQVTNTTTRNLLAIQYVAFPLFHLYYLPFSTLRHKFFWIKFKICCVWMLYEQFFLCVVREERTKQCFNPLSGQVAGLGFYSVDCRLYYRSLQMLLFKGQHDDTDIAIKCAIKADGLARSPGQSNSCLLIQCNICDCRCDFRCW